MSNVRCLIIDDEDLARELIATHLAQLDGFEIVASCASAIEAANILKQQPIDLMFLDIEMPVLKGIDFYKNLLQKPKVIFTTAYRDYAVEGFDLDAVDYLLKPITFSRFFKAVERYLASTTALDNQAGKPVKEPNISDQTNHLFVRKDRKQVKVELEDIVYVKGLKDYVQIHLQCGTTHITKSSMNQFEKQLGQGFLRIHRSYIINRSKITAFSRQDVELGEIEIPIGESYRYVIESI